MEITIPRTTYDRVNLTPENVVEVTKKKLQDMLYPGDYVTMKHNGKKDKTLWLAKDEDHYHGSVGTEYIREATEDEIILYKALCLIK